MRDYSDQAWVEFNSSEGFLGFMDEWSLRVVRDI